MEFAIQVIKNSKKTFMRKLKELQENTESQISKIRGKNEQNEKFDKGIEIMKRTKWKFWS